MTDLATSGNLWRLPVEYDQRAATFQKANGELLMHYFRNRLREPAEVLDLGCGTGVLLESIAREFGSAKLIGVDISTDMVSEAKRRFKGSAFNADFFVDNVMTMPARRSPIVISNAALHWFADSIEHAMARVASLVDAGGMLCVATAGTCAEAVAFDRRIMAVVSKGDLEHPFTRRRTGHIALTRMGEACGLRGLDSFSLLRTSKMSASGYATWLMASGFELETREPGAMDELAGSLEREFGSELEVAHCTTFAILVNP